MDQYFTPPELAACAVNVIPDLSGCVADFAVGAGNLLSAAAVRWPRAPMVGTDIDRSCVTRLREMRPNWKVGRCDFLREQSRQRSAVLRGREGTISLALLNPPFSYRGGTRYPARVGSVDLSCSIAAAFMAQALPYLESHGKIVAILPASSPQSEMDAMFYRQLSRHGSFRVLGEFGPETFPECSARSVLALFDRYPKTRHEHQSKQVQATSRHCIVRRGVVGMNTVGNPRNAFHRFIHTSNLQDGRASVVLRRTPKSQRIVRHPAVLLPRVGRPDIRKICGYASGKSAILSDCVFALHFDTAQDARRCLALIREEWSTLRKAYGGTCAPYLTIQRLKIFLRSIGYDGRVER